MRKVTTIARVILGGVVFAVAMYAVLLAPGLLSDSASTVRKRSMAEVAR